MARPKKLNQASTEVIEKEFLNESPEGFPPIKLDEPVKVVTKMPEMETIIFRNDRDPGIPLEFHYATATHPLHSYKLFHDKEYTLAREVVEHLEQCSIPIYGYRKGYDGHPEMYMVGRRHQFSCKHVRKAA